MAGEKGSAPNGGRGMKFAVKASQEIVVVAISACLFVVFSVALNNFLTEGNLIALLKNVSILGTLAVGMGFVVMGREAHPLCLGRALCAGQYRFAEMDRLWNGLGTAGLGPDLCIGDRHQHAAL